MRDLAQSAVLGAALLALACSGQQADLGQISKDPSAIAVVKDVAGAYWAVGVSDLRAEASTLVVNSGALVAKGATNGPAEVEKRLADRLADLLRKARGGGFVAQSFDESGATTTTTFTETDASGKTITRQSTTSTAPDAISGRLETLKDGGRIEVVKVLRTGS